MARRRRADVTGPAMLPGPENGARRILILAPHPDDEIVACGIAALRARATGARVFVLYLTTGVPPREALWPWRRSWHAAQVSRRRAEAEAAALLFSLEPTGFRETSSRGLRSDLDPAMRDIEGALRDCGARALWVPAFEGGHQDHDAANALASRFSNRLPVFEFATYNLAGGRVRANRFAVERGGEAIIAASAAEAARKRRGLACYVSERGNLRHVEVARESWRPLPRHDYCEKPHPGRLFRERFQCLPFRHPRVDFAPSAAVYREIGGWTSAPLEPHATPSGDPPGEEPRQADGELAGTLD